MFLIEFRFQVSFYVGVLQEQFRQFRPMLSVEDGMHRQFIERAPSRKSAVGESVVKKT
jgi:hypothetical protein